MNNHIEIALKEIEKIATFNSGAKLFKDCLKSFFHKFNIKTRIDVENLNELTKGENLDKLYWDNNGNITIIDGANDDLEKVFDTSDISCPKLEVAARIIKDKNNIHKSVLSFDDILKEFNEKFCNDQGNYNPEFIQYVISHKELSMLNVAQEISYHFIKSFLNAEFFILDDFSNKIIGTIEAIKTYYKEFIDINDKSFNIIESFIKILYYAIEMCNKQAHYFHNKNGKLICINNDRKLRFYRNPEFSPIKFTIGDKTDVLRHERLMESVVDVSVIDLNYTVTDDNFDKLFRLWRRIQVSEKIERDVHWQNAFVMLKTKTAILLKRMLDSKEKNRDYKIINIENEKKEIDKYFQDFIGSSLEKQKEFFKQNSFIEIAENNKGKILDKSKFEFLLYDSFSYERNQKDVFAHDDYAQKGIEIYCNNSLYFDKLKKKTFSIEDVNNLSKILENEDKKYKYLNNQTLYITIVRYNLKLI